MKKKLARPNRDELIAWRREGKTLQQIAEDQKVSYGLVKLWVKEMGAIRPRGAKRPPRKLVKRKDDRAFFAHPEEGMSKMEMARYRLGDRLKERRGYYYLDDRYVTTQQLLDAAGI